MPADAAEALSHLRTTHHGTTPPSFFDYAIDYALTPPC